jgi:hypothetical protein
MKYGLYYVCLSQSTVQPMCSVVPALTRHPRGTGLYSTATQDPPPPTQTGHTSANKSVECRVLYKLYLICTISRPPTTNLCKRNWFANVKVFELFDLWKGVRRASAVKRITHKRSHYLSSSGTAPHVPSLAIRRSRYTDKNNFTFVSQYGDEATRALV